MSPASVTVRLGLVGAGRWGRRYPETIKRMWPGGEVVVSSVAGRSDWADLVCSASVDGLIVATPAATHFQIARTALDAGLPVLVEKPAVLSGADAKALRDAAAASGVPVRVAHQHVHSTAFAALRDWARHGRISAVRSDAGGPGPHRADCNALWDYAPHDLAMVCRLAASGSEAFRLVKAERHTAHGDGESWRIRASVDGVEVDSRVSNALTGKRHRFHVVLSDGAEAVYDDFAPEKLVIEGRPVSVSDEKPLDRLIRSFLGSITAPSTAETSDELEDVERITSLLAAAEAAEVADDA